MAMQDDTETVPPQQALSPAAIMGKEEWEQVVAAHTALQHHQEGALHDVEGDITASHPPPALDPAFLPPLPPLAPSDRMEEDLPRTELHPR